MLLRTDTIHVFMQGMGIVALPAVRCSLTRKHLGFVSKWGGNRLKWVVPLRIPFEAHQVPVWEPPNGLSLPREKLTKWSKSAHKTDSPRILFETSPNQNPATGTPPPPGRVAARGTTGTPRPCEAKACGSPPCLQGRTKGRRKK